MKLRAQLSRWLLLSAASICSAQAIAASLLPERVYKAAQQRVEANAYPTVVFGFVDADKSEVIGFGELADGRAPDGDTVFEIGSVTKTFTATLLAEAVQSGQLKLDTPLAQLLPDFKIPARNDKQITLIDIATQHSGLPRLPTNLAPANPENPYADYDAAKLKAFLAGYALTRDPGESYEYSNLAFGLLGFALAQHAHMSYGGLLEKKILSPLDMTTSGIALSDTMRAHLAPGHGDDGKPAKNWDFDALAGAGAIRSSANDMLKYLKANMGTSQSALTTAMKLAQQLRRDVGKDERIGLAWMTRHAAPTDIVWHNGMTGGYASFAGFSADGRRGVVVLTNIAANVDDLGFAALIADAPLAPASKSVTLDATALDDYAGDYKLAEHFIIHISRNDAQLYAQATGQGAFPIFASGTNEFFAKVGGIRMSFNRDAQGKVSGLVLHQNGDRTAPKLSAAQVPTTTKSIQLEPEVLHEYVGKYQLAPSAIIDVSLNGNQLHVQLTGQPAFAVYASAKDSFFLTVVDAKIDFERDSQGHVVSLTLHQNGQNQRAARISP